LSRPAGQPRHFVNLPPDSEAREMTDIKQHEVKLAWGGSVSVFVQGDHGKLHENDEVFLTVHDLGENHESIVDFTMHPAMAEITNRSLYLHVDLPGQEPGAADLDGDYPSMQDIGTHLVTVLDSLKVSSVVGIGNGLGGNILARFAMLHPGRCHGVVLMNTTANSSSAGSAVIQQIKEAVGAGKKAADEINTKNVSKLTEAYKKRSEFLSLVNEKFKVDALMLAGAKHKVVEDADTMQRKMKPGISSLVKMDDISLPIVEACEKTGEAILLFCQGLGLLPAQKTQKMQRCASISEAGECAGSCGGKAGRRLSMEQHDQPDIGRLQLASS